MKKILKATIILTLPVINYACWMQTQVSTNPSVISQGQQTVSSLYSSSANPTNSNQSSPVGNTNVEVSPSNVIQTISPAMNNNSGNIITTNPTNGTSINTGNTIISTPTPTPLIYQQIKGKAKV